ncbi:perforin-1-like [Trichomycterus rosablanca]|uniref:perforin-1-like n=1 Tax=Trichomycterus rosablanca TaxID=2290929 RepID=UPI002F35D5E1
MGWLWFCLGTYSLLCMSNAEERLTLGGPYECKTLKFVPGYNFGGEGFDVVKMERKGTYVINMETWDLGNGTCQMATNNYVREKQKLPAAVVFWRTLPKCSIKVKSKVYESSESLVKDSTSSISNNWKSGLNVPLTGSLAVGGTHARESSYAMQKSKQDKYSFTKHEVQCSYYNYKIASSPPLHYEFLQSINDLTPRSDLIAYQQVIDTFGTHYTRGVKLGGKVKAVTSIKTCQASTDGLTDTAVKDCLDAEASATYKGVTVTAESQYCQALKKKIGKKKSFSSMFSDRETEVVGGNVANEDLFSSQASVHKVWLESLKTVPDVVTYDLKPLHLLLKKNHPAQKGLKMAIEKYIKDNALKKVCSESCSIGRRSSVRDPCACVCGGCKNMLPNCCPTERGLATLKVFKLYAKGLYGDTWSQTDGFVHVKYDQQSQRTREITNNDNPHWPETFLFDTIKISLGSKLTFKVYDVDTPWNKDLLGQCSINLKSGTKKNMCTFQHGTFYFSYTVECAPGLQGPTCAEHKSNPMNAKLAEIFHSRNGILVKNMWKLEQAQNNVTNPDVQVYSEK